MGFTIDVSLFSAYEKATTKIVVANFILPLILPAFASVLFARYSAEIFAFLRKRANVTPMMRPAMPWTALTGILTTDGENP